MSEDVALEAEAPRVHQGGPGDAPRERVIGEHVVIGVHVVDTVAHIGDVVSADRIEKGKTEEDPVLRRPDGVVLDTVVPGRIEIDCVTSTFGFEGRDARNLVPPDDVPFALDKRNAVERFANDVVFDDGVIAAQPDRGGLIRDVDPGPLDDKTADGYSIRGDEDYIARSSAIYHGSSLAGKGDRLVDHHLLPVRPRRNYPGIAGCGGTDARRD